MTVVIDDFYRSSNGDRWQLLRDTASGRRVVRHKPTLALGGQVTEFGVEEFLDRIQSREPGFAGAAQKSWWCQPVTGCHAKVVFANANKSPAAPPQIGVNRT